MTKKKQEEKLLFKTSMIYGSRLTQIVCLFRICSDLRADWGLFHWLGDVELVAEKSDEVIGIDIESWVEFMLFLSPSSPDHESLGFGHSSKKGRRDWVSFLIVSVIIAVPATEAQVPYSSFPKKQCCWAYEADMADPFLTGDASRGQVLSNLDALVSKLWRSSSDLTACVYLPTSTMAPIDPGYKKMGIWRKLVDLFTCNPWHL